MVTGDLVEVTNTTLETTIFSYVIQGGTLGTFSRMRLEALTDLNVSATPPNLSMKVYLGGDNMDFLSADALVTGTYSPKLTVDVYNRGDLAVQRCNAMLYHPDYERMAQGPFIADTSADQEFKMTVTFSAADTTQFFFYEPRLIIK